jgi:hypothetical protein
MLIATVSGTPDRTMFLAAVRRWHGLQAKAALSYDSCMNKLAHRCWATAICILGTSISANAECVSIEGSLPGQVRLSAFVFDGTVRRVDQVASDGTLTRVDDADLSTRTNPEGWRYPLIYVATMDVHRVWTGDVLPAIKVYFVWNWDGPRFKTGVRRIVFARAETEGIRKALGIDPRSPQRDAWVLPCSGAPTTDDEAVIKQLGPPRKPSLPPEQSSGRPAQPHV